MNNILEGLIWFWVPASLVICNDIFAYVWGMTLGRTPLIKLSPKKTVEGFVGAFISTIFFAIVWGTYFSRFNYMICPVHDLGVNAWSNIECVPNPVFVWRDWKIWAPVAKSLSAVVSSITFPVHACSNLAFSDSWRDQNDCIHAVSNTLILYGLLRIAGRAFRRILCVGFQACIRHQRFRS
jgi:CDP-diglyceride synthetase